jgi:hypothetical protein
VYALRVVTSLVVGDTQLEQLHEGPGLLVAYVVLLRVAVGCAVGLRRATAARVPLLLTGGLSLAYLVVPLAVRGTGFLLDRDPFTLNGSRFTVLPVLFLATTIVVLLDRQPDSGSGWARPDVRVTVAAVAAVTAVAGFGGVSVTSFGPSWSSDVDRARQVCRGERADPRADDSVAASSSATEVRLPVAGGGEPATAFVTVPCSRLVSP